MNIEKLENIIEAILFVSGNGISLTELQESLGLQKSEINKALSVLKEKYGGDSGIKILNYNGKVQFGSNPQYADSVAQVLNPIREKELSTAAMETIAIIAYRQPVTRLEIEQIRGVNCDYTVQVLLNHNLIEVVGRKEAVGKPLLLGTTEAFLRRFGISSLGELPDYEQLLETIRILTERNSNASGAETGGSIYNEFVIPSEEETNQGGEAAAESFENEEEIPEFLQGETNLKKVNGNI